MKNVGQDRSTPSWPAGWKTPSACTRARQGTGTRREPHRAAAGHDLACRAAPTSGASSSTPRRHRLRGFPEGNLRGLGGHGHGLRQGPDPQVADPRLPGRRGRPGGPRGQLPCLRAGRGRRARRTVRRATLTSKPFVIERHFITFWIGGGNHPGKTCINLLVDGKVVRTATGHNSNRMRRESLDVRQFEGKTARLQIVDNESGPWGNIGIAQIVFTDRARREAGRAARLRDAGPGLARTCGGRSRHGGDWRGTICRRRPSRKAIARRKRSRSGRSSSAPWRGSSRSPPDRRPTATLRHRLAFPQSAAEGRRAVLRHAVPVGRGGRRARGRELRLAGQADAAVARHLVRLDAALLVPRPHVAQHLDPGHLHLPPVRHRPVLRLGGRRLLRGHVHPRLALRPCRGPALPRAGARSPRAGPISAWRMNPKTGVIQHRGEGRRPGGRRPGGLHPARLSRAPDVRRRRASSSDLWPQDQAGHGVPDPDGRRATASSTARSTTRSTSRWFGQVAWLSSLYLAAAPGVRGDGQGDGRRGLRPASAGDLRAGQPQHRPRAVQRRVLHPHPRPGSTPRASARTTAARSTRSSARAGPSRSASDASSPRST